MGSGGSKRKGKVSRVGRGEELDAILGDNPNRPVAERLSALRARIQALQTHITKIESEEATKLVKGSRATAGISSVKITPTGGSKENTNANDCLPHDRDVLRHNCTVDDIISHSVKHADKHSKLVKRKQAQAKRKTQLRLLARQQPVR